VSLNWRVFWVVLIIGGGWWIAHRIAHGEAWWS